MIENDDEKGMALETDADDWEQMIEDRQEKTDAGMKEMEDKCL